MNSDTDTVKPPPFLDCRQAAPEVMQPTPISVPTARDRLMARRAHDCGLGRLARYIAAPARLGVDRAWGERP